MRRTRGCERGSQVVELAIALPLLLLLAFLVSEVAALVRVHQVINNAAREGARVAVLDNGNRTNPTPVVTAAVNAYVTTYVPAACAPGTLTTTVDPNVTMVSDGYTFKATKVDVSCNYQWVSFKANTFWSSIPATIPLRGTATFRNFYGS